MSDDKSKRGPADRSRINIHEPYELKHWAEHFGVSEVKIQEAVSKVGVMVDDVKQHLGK